MLYVKNFKLLNMTTTTNDQHYGSEPATSMQSPMTTNALTYEFSSLTINPIVKDNIFKTINSKDLIFYMIGLSYKIEDCDQHDGYIISKNHTIFHMCNTLVYDTSAIQEWGSSKKFLRVTKTDLDNVFVNKDFIYDVKDVEGRDRFWLALLYPSGFVINSELLSKNIIKYNYKTFEHDIEEIRQPAVPSKQELEEEANMARLKRSLEQPKKFAKRFKNKHHKPTMHYPKKECWKEIKFDVSFNGVSDRAKDLLKYFLSKDKIDANEEIVNDVTLDEAIQLFGTVDKLLTFKLCGFGYTKELPQTRKLTPFSRIFDPSMYNGANMSSHYDDALIWHYDHNDHHPEYWIGDFTVNEKMSYKATIHFWNDILISGLRIYASPYDSLVNVRKWVFNINNGFYEIKPKFASINPAATIAWLSRCYKFGLSANENYEHRNHVLWREKPPKQGEFSDVANFMKNPTWPGFFTLSGKYPKLHHFLQETYAHIRDVNALNTIFNIREPHDNDKLEIRSLVSYYYNWSLKKFEDKPIPTSGDDDENVILVDYDQDEAFRDLLRTNPDLNNYSHDQAGSSQDNVVQPDSEPMTEEETQNWIMRMLSKIPGVETITAWIRDTFSTVFSSTSKAIASVVKSILEPVTAALTSILQYFKTIVDKTSGIIGILTSPLLKILNFIKNFFCVSVDFLKNLDWFEIVRFLVLIMMYNRTSGVARNMVAVYLIYNVFGQVKQLEEFKIIFTSFNKDVEQPTSGEDGEAGLISTIISYFTESNIKGIGKVIAIFLCVTMGLTITAEVYSKIGSTFMNNMKNMHFLGAGLFGLERVFKYVPAFFETCWQWARKMTGLQTEEEKENEKKRADASLVAQWVSDIALYDTSAGRNLIICDPTHSAKIPRLYATSVELYKRAQLREFSPEINMAISKDFNKMTTIYNTWFQSVSNSTPRKTPFHVQFVGKPGIGKTTLLTLMKNWLKDTYYSRIAEDKLAYHRGNTKHWDGWENQPITIYDEAFKYKDPEMITEMLCVVSNSPTLLPSASLDSKGLNYFNSEWILSTTNTTYPTCADVYCIEAIQRRRHMLVEVVIDPDVVDKSTSKFDKKLFDRKYPGLNSADCPHLTFNLLPSVDPTYGKGTPSFSQRPDNKCDEDEVPRPPGVDPPTNDLNFDSFISLVKNRRTAMVAEEELIIGKTSTYKEKLTNARNELLAYMLSINKTSTEKVNSELCRLNDWYDYYTKTDDSLFATNEMRNAAETVNAIAAEPTNDESTIDYIMRMRKTGGLDPSCSYTSEDIIKYDAVTGQLRVAICNPYRINTRLYADGEVLDLSEVNTHTYKPIYYGTPRAMRINGVMVQKWQTTKLDCTLLKYTTTTEGTYHLSLPKWYTEPLYKAYMSLSKNNNPIYYRGFPLGRDNLTFAEFIMTMPLFRDHIAAFYSMSVRDIQFVVHDVTYQLYHQLYRKKMRNVYDTCKKIYEKTYDAASFGLNWFYSKMQTFYNCKFIKVLFSLLSAIGISYAMYKVASFFFPSVEPTSRYIFKNPARAVSLIPTSRELDSLSLKISKGMYEMKVGGTKNCVAVGYKEHYYLLPYHTVRQYLDKDQDIQIYMLPTRNSDQFWHAIVPSKNFKLIEGTDTVVMFCDKFNMTRDLSSSFRQKNNNEVKYWHDGVTLMYPQDNMIHSKEARLSRVLNSQVFNVYGKTDYTSIAVYDYEAPRGSSGGLLLTEDPTGKHQVILGMQSFRMGSESYASVLYREDIEKTISFLPSFVKIHTYHGDVNEEVIPTSAQYLEGHIDIIGKIHKREQVHIPSTSKFENTTISKHLKQYETDWIPAVLDQNDPRVPEGAHILQNSINKCARDVIKEPELQVQNMAVDGVVRYLRSIVNEDCLKIYNVNEAVRGPRGEGTLENKTSPGLPWVHTPGKLPGKKNWVNHTEEGLTLLDEEFLEYHHLQYSKFSEGEIFAGNMFDFPKDELRPMAKALGPPIKTRSITVQDFSVSVIWRRLVLSLEGELHSSSNGLSIFAPGMNPESIHWHNLYERLTRVSHNGADFDIGNWDGHFPAWLMWLSRDAICQIMGYDRDSKEWMAMTSVLHYSLYGYSQFGDCLYRKNRGLPSGFAGTTSINTIGHMILFYIFYIKICYNTAHHKMADFSTFIHNVSLVVYNDDILFTVSDFIKDWFNAITISEMYENFGWPITSGDKTSEIRPFKNIHDCTFLKRKFRRDNSIPYVVWAPIDLKVVHNLIHWIRRSPDMKQQLYDNVINILFFLISHGRNVFDSYLKDINAALKKSGNRVFLTTYDTIKEDFLDRYLDANIYIEQEDYDENYI